MPDDALWARPRSASDLGPFLAEVRRDRGLTQAELADLLAISRRAVYEIEGGKATQHVERLFGILRLLGVTLEVRATPRATDQSRTSSELDW